MLHACVQKFDVTGNFENFWELNMQKFDVTENFENFWELNMALDFL